MSDAERLARAGQAAHEFTALEHAFSTVEAALVARLIETPPGHDEKVVRLHMAVSNLAQVRQCLLLVAQDGMMAEAAIAVAGLTRN